MATTKIYENRTDKPVNVIGVGVIAAHDRISVTTDFHAPVNLVNYPGVVDLVEEEAKNGPAVAPETPTREASASNGTSGDLQATKIPGEQE